MLILSSLVFGGSRPFQWVAYALYRGLDPLRGFSGGCGPFNEPTAGLIPAIQGSRSNTLSFMRI